MPQPIRAAPIDTPIGRLWVAATADGVVAIERGEDPLGLGVETAAGPAHRAGRQIAEYLAGERQAFTVPLDLAGVAPFDAAVYRAVMTIPHGATASYAEMALAIGTPRAARAVGNALARCRLSPIVPCHRVIHADGTLGGWGSETWVKRWLLDLEQDAR